MILTIVATVLSVTSVVVAILIWLDATAAYRRADDLLGAARRNYDAARRVYLATLELLDEVKR